jgi:hypothetical protein
MRSFDRRPELCESIRPSYSSRCKAVSTGHPKGAEPRISLESNETHLRALVVYKRLTHEVIHRRGTEPPLGRAFAFSVF